MLLSEEPFVSLYVNKSEPRKPGSGGCIRTSQLN